MTPEDAKELSIQGVRYLAGDHEQLGRFLSLSGLAPEDIRGLVGESSFQVAVLDYFLGHEPSLISFAASMGIDPKDVAAAKYALNPEHIEGW